MQKQVISSTDLSFYLSFFHSWFCPCIRPFKKNFHNIHAPIYESVPLFR